MRSYVIYGRILNCNIRAICDIYQTTQAVAVADCYIVRNKNSALPESCNQTTNRSRYVFYNRVVQELKI